MFPVFDGEEALQMFDNAQIDLVLLDLMLPKLNGIEFLKRIRGTSFVPVLIISAKESDIDKTLALGFGADDYISKPFSVIELTARFHAVIRRARSIFLLRRIHLPTLFNSNHLHSTYMVFCTHKY